jgi:hypothetical protein
MRTTCPRYIPLALSMIGALALLHAAPSVARAQRADDLRSLDALRGETVRLSPRSGAPAMGTLDSVSAGAVHVDRQRHAIDSLRRIEVLASRSRGAGVVRGMALGAAAGGTIGSLAAPDMSGGLGAFTIVMSTLGGGLAGAVLGTGAPVERWQRVSVPGAPPGDALALDAGTHVCVRTATGSARGEIERVDADTLALRADGARRAFAMSDVHALDLAAGRPRVATALVLGTVAGLATYAIAEGRMHTAETVVAASATAAVVGFTIAPRRWRAVRLLPR